MRFIFSLSLSLSLSLLDWGLNQLSAHKAGTLLLEPHLQSILLWLFWRWGLANSLFGLTSNHNPPDLSSQLARITDMSHQYLAEIPSLINIKIGHSSSPSRDDLLSVH
jgi:hypothetical protein